MFLTSLLCSALVALAATVRSAVANDFDITPSSSNYAGNITFTYNITAPLVSYQGQTYQVALYRNTSDNNYAGTEQAVLDANFVPGESGVLSYPLDAPLGDDYYIRIIGPSEFSNSPVFTVEEAPLTGYANVTNAAVFKSIKQPQEGTHYTGDVIIIIWDVSVPGGKPAAIDLVTTKNSIATLYKELATVQPNATTYTWTIGTDIPSNTYAIRLGYPASNSVVYSPTFSVIASKATANSTNSDAADILQGNGFIAWSVAFATALTVLAGGLFLQ